MDSGLPVTITGGTRLADGTLLLVDQAGHALQSRDQGRSFRRLQLAHASPASAVAQAADGALVVSGPRGVKRVPLPAQAGK